MYNNLRPEELGQADLKTAFGILLRIAYEKFPVQEKVPPDQAGTLGVLDVTSALLAFIPGPFLPEPGVQRDLGHPGTRRL